MYQVIGFNMDILFRNSDFLSPELSGSKSVNRLDLFTSSHVPNAPADMYATIGARD